MPYDRVRFTWKETRELIEQDYTRLHFMLRRGQEQEPILLWCHPAFLCSLLYRLSNHCFRAGHRYLARLFWHLNMLLTGADISEPASLGGGLVILSPAGASIMGKAGRNLTVMPCAGLGGEMGRLVDVGAGPGVPLLGDDVILEPHSGVLGPVKVGNRVRVGAGMALCFDVADDTYVESPNVRFLPRRDL